MPTAHREEGIVLRSVDYRDTEKIVTIFTKNEGRVELIVKGLKANQTEKRALCSPLSCSEFVYTSGRTELCRLIDITSIDPFLALREKLSFLQEAGRMTRALLTSQLPGKASPLLYALFRSYLGALPSFPAPEVVSASFQLKLLRHEGILHLSSFSKGDQELLQLLAFATNLPLLRSLSPPPGLLEQINHHFETIIA